jgi:hypothetical protein
VETSSHSIGQLDPRMLQEGGRLRMDGEIAIPAHNDDVNDAVARWVRELARAAGLAEFEPEAES